MNSKKIVSIIPNVVFNIIQFPVMTALKLERKINLIFLPAIGGFLKNADLSKMINMDVAVDFKNIFDGFIEGLEKLSDQEYENLILNLMSRVQVEITGKPIREMDKSVFEEVFQGNLFAVYKLMFEIMKFNKFSFFVLVEMLGGLEMIKTNSSGILTKNKKK